MNHELERLIQQGDYRGAAQLAEHLGFAALARDLFEKLFDYQRAGQLAESQGDHLRAIELFLKGNQLESAESVRRRLMAELSDDIKPAIALFEQRAFFLQAAELAESIGDLARAAELYERATSHARAGRLYERIGNIRKAGEAYEAHLRGNAEDPAANLGLARVLQRFGRHRDAVWHLSRAIHDVKTAEEAARRLAFAFFKLGFLEAGRATAVRIGLPRNLDPDRFLRPLEAELLHGEGNQDGQAALQGRFRVERPLTDRAGACFLARDLLREGQVVLRFTAGSAEDNAEFYDELRRLSNPPLPGAARILEINAESGFVATEAFDAPTLLQLLQSPAPPNATRARGIAIQIFETVRRAHERGILHGSINPRAVLVAPGDVCRVVDWGLQLLERRLETQTGGPESAFAYRAPEINLGRPGDFTSDLYSIAALLHRCLTGQAPQLGSPDLAALPREFQDFFRRALAPNAAQRHPSHDHFRRELTALPWHTLQHLTLEPAAAEAGPAREGDDRPRFIPADPGAAITDAEDTLLGRPVRLLRLPPEDQRPIALIDRLHALASPECPVFQDILAFDAAQNALVLEAIHGVPLREWIAQRGPLDLHALLDAAAALLYALDTVHAQNIGLGTLSAELTLYDGASFRVPIEPTLLANANTHHNHTPIPDDARAFFDLLYFALTGRTAPDPSPGRLLAVLRAEGHLAPQDHDQLTRALPSPNPSSLAGWTDWFATLERTLDNHITRKAIFQQLHALAHADRKLTDAERTFLDERRRALGLD